VDINQGACEKSTAIGRASKNAGDWLAGGSIREEIGVQRTV
jgi:hypothetical protein